MPASVLSPARVSAPGKIILMGEHAAVFGRPALVAAIDKRATAHLDVAPGDSLVLDLPDLGIEQRWTWASLRDYAGERRAAWHLWSEDRGRPFQEVLGVEPAHLVATAVGEVLASTSSLPAVGARLVVSSEVPMGAGFGSSAAVATAVVGALVEGLGMALDTGAQERLVLEVERRQHGSPSGVDGAAVARGGVVWARPGRGGPEVERVMLSPEVLRAIRVASTGIPPESTGEVVAAVARRRAAAPETFDTALEEASTAVRRFRELLAHPEKSVEILVCWRRFSSWLRGIGVVPDPIGRLIERIEAQGGAGKISGAGSLVGPGAGSFLVYHPDLGTLEDLRRLEGLEVLDVALGGDGVRRES